jgi:mannan endo-1,4-beta-mannosidase
MVRSTFSMTIPLFLSLIHTDVTEIPDQGSYFQLIANGTTAINTGLNGLQRLDKVIELAEKNDIKIIFSLTNNWNPIAKQSSASGSPPLPHNYLSNDYG